MQKLWKLTCDFCGKSFDRQKDRIVGKKYTLRNISFEVNMHDTYSQGATTLNSFDLCNKCASRLIKFINENVKDPKGMELDNLFTDWHESDPNDNNAYYREGPSDCGSTWLFTSLEDYKNEPDCN